MSQIKNSAEQKGNTKIFTLEFSFLFYFRNIRIEQECVGVYSLYNLGALLRTKIDQVFPEYIFMTSLY